MAQLKNVAEFSGRGRNVTDPFDLDNAVTVFRFENKGDSNFILELTDLETGEETTVLNEIGPCDGSAAETIAGGQYIMDVTAEGPWKIIVQQYVS